MSEPEEEGSIVLTKGAKILWKQYGVIPPETSITVVDGLERFNIEHHRCQVNFVKSAAGDMSGQKELNEINIFPIKDPMKISIMGIGIKSWFSESHGALGVTFYEDKTTPIPGTILMGTESKFSYTVPAKGQDPKAYEMVFETKPPTEFGKRFPQWSAKDVETGVERGKLKYLLPLPSGEDEPIECPLAVFHAMLNKKNPYSGQTIVLNEKDYQETAKEFKNSVGDGRIHALTNQFGVKVQQPLGAWYNCSMVIDVFYSLQTTSKPKSQVLG
jgi:hypothetical protein